MTARLMHPETVRNSDHLIAQGRITGVRHLIADAQEREHRVVGRNRNHVRFCVRVIGRGRGRGNQRDACQSYANEGANQGSRGSA